MTDQRCSARRYGSGLEVDCVLPSDSLATDRSAASKGVSVEVVLFAVKGWSVVCVEVCSDFTLRPRHL